MEGKSALPETESRREHLELPVRFSGAYSISKLVLCLENELHLGIMTVKLTEVEGCGKAKRT